MRIVLVGLFVVLLGVLTSQHSVAAAKEAKDAKDVKSSPLSILEQVSGPLSDTYGQLENLLDAKLGFNPTDIWQRTLALGGQVHTHVQTATSKAQSIASTRFDDLKTQFADSATQITNFQQTLTEALAATNALRKDIATYTSAGASDEEKAEVQKNLEGELGKVFARVMDEVRAEFPPPEHAPSHQEREEMVEKVLGKVVVAVRDALKGLGVGEEDVERIAGSFEKLMPHVKTLLVIAGDLAEQHPQLLKTLLFIVAGMILPEAWILRQLLSLFGFGVLGPSKGTAAAWAQRVFFGALVPEGSWFAKLQKLGMTLV